VNIHGTISQTLDDGSVVEAHYMIDTEKGELVQVGGEGEITAEDIDLIKSMMGLDTDSDDEDAGWAQTSGGES
jgi:hypothetical protein